MNTITDRLKIIMGPMSGREFAKKLGKSPTTVNEYLKGRIPPADFIELVCVQFKINPWWLLAGEGEMYAPPVAVEGTENYYYSDLEKKVINLMRTNPDLAKDIILAATEIVLKARTDKK
jgi:hypothetical protein